MYGHAKPRGYTTLVALLLSLVVGLAGGTLVLSAAALAGPPTLAQAGPVLAAASAPDSSPGTDPLVALGQAALVVNVALLFLRHSVTRRWFDPPVATDASRTLCLAAALVVGLVLGLAGVAPPWGAGIGGQLTGGFVAAGLAVFGHSAVKRGYRATRRKAKTTEAAK